MVGGIQDATNERNLDLLLFSSGKEILKVDPFDHILKQTSIDGLIILNTRYTSHDFNNQLIEHLRERDLNFVIVHYYWGKEKIKYVGVDYEKDVFTSVSYLASIGHKNIGLITGLSQAMVTNRIIKGYQKALKKNNINIQNRFIASADYDPELAYKVTQRLINENSSLTALFVADYEMAFSSLKAIKDLKKKVPKDISLISYVDHELFPFLDPPLSSVKLPYYEIGKKAVELLLDNKEKGKRIIFETELVLRNSTAAV
jgi:DNA-binding LacI/PurR family transcriptional regulator